MGASQHPPWTCIHIPPGWKLDLPLSLEPRVSWHPGCLEPLRGASKHRSTNRCVLVTSPPETLPSAHSGRLMAMSLTRPKPKANKPVMWN